MTELSEYTSWAEMKRRCYTKQDEAYKNYGGRGIRVCERWRTSFPNFLADMGRKPTAGHSIDRFPNNNGNYQPGNCRWATRKEHGRNTRRTKLNAASAKNIQRLYSEGKYDQYELSVMFDVSQTHISQIVLDKIWV